MADPNLNWRALAIVNHWLSSIDPRMLRPPNEHVRHTYRALTAAVRGASLAEWTAEPHAFLNMLNVRDDLEQIYFDDVRAAEHALRQVLPSYFSFHDDSAMRAVHQVLVDVLGTNNVMTSRGLRYRRREARRQRLN